MIALVGLAFYICERRLGWFSHNWLSRQVPHFVMANGVGLMIPLWVWRDVLVILIVLSVGHELFRVYQRRQTKRLAAVGPTEV